MSWVTIIWSMVAAACLTLAAMHLRIWGKKRTAWANLLFAVTAVATAAVAGCELWMMRAETAREFGAALRWGHVPFWVLVLALVAFVRLYLRAGRPWLAWTVCVIRTVSLLPNFLVGENLNYRTITGLRHVPFLGDSVAVAEGIVNPWIVIGLASLVLLVIFVADATLTVWRRGDRPPLVWLGGTIVCFVMGRVGQFVLTFWGVISEPITPSLFFLGIVVMMAYEMSSEVLRAADLADDLRKREDWLDLAADSAGVGLWLWEFRTNRLWFTEKTRTLYGFSSHGPVPFAAFLSTLHPDDREWVARAGQQCSQEGADFRDDYRVVMPDGSIRWVRVLAKAFVGSSGKPERMTGVSFDISERRQVEERLRTSEALSTGVLASLPGQMVIVDRSGSILRTSDTWQAFAARDGTLDPTTLAVTAGSPHVRPRAVEQVGPVVKEIQGGIDAVLSGTHAEFRLDYAYPTRTEERWASVTVLPLQRPEGGAVIYRQDITLQQRSRLEVEQLRRDLTHVSRVTTMGEMTAALAHELNQPLTAIVSNALAGERYLAHEAPPLDEIREILQDVARDARRASEVIQRLRSLLRKEEPRFVPLDVNQAAREIAALVHTDTVLRNVAIDLELAPDLPPVRGDRIQLQQVLLNLLLNAMDAMTDVASNARRITVRVQAAGPQVEVAVSDTGPGIPEDKLARVFDPFFTTKPTGLGMGLAISRGIIEAHRGRLRAGRNEAGGATFTLTLPVVEGGDAT
jgi:PAS domain S-box-containing protein